MGKYDSSKTRVRPFFNQLRQVDSSGESWLPKLLRAAPFSANIESFASDPGRIAKVAPVPNSSKERLIGPPTAFLRWLLQNPERLRWQKDGGTKDLVKREWREKLCSKTTGETQRELALDRTEAIREGLRLLNEFGAGGARQQWWAFEGQTHVDFFIETDRGFRIYVEGKRTEALSSSTAWFPWRNQFVRNIEAAREDANGAPFAFLLMSEIEMKIPLDAVGDGLPHLETGERRDLLRHYIGNITWKRACDLPGFPYVDLPDTCATRPNAIN